MTSPAVWWCEYPVVIISRVLVCGYWHVIASHKPSIADTSNHAVEVMWFALFEGVFLFIYFMFLFIIILF